MIGGVSGDIFATRYNHVASCDVPRFLTNSYQSQSGVEPEKAISAVLRYSLSVKICYLLCKVKTV